MNPRYKQIVGGRILTPQGWLYGGSVIVEGTKILGVENTQLSIQDAERIDVHGADMKSGEYLKGQKEHDFGSRTLFYRIRKDGFCGIESVTHNEHPKDADTISW